MESLKIQRQLDGREGIIDKAVEHKRSDLTKRLEAIKTEQEQLEQEEQEEKAKQRQQQQEEERRRQSERKIASAVVPREKYKYEQTIVDGISALYKMVNRIEKSKVEAKDEKIEEVRRKIADLKSLFENPAKPTYNDAIYGGVKGDFATLEERIKNVEKEQTKYKLKVELDKKKQEMKSLHLRHTAIMNVLKKAGIDEEMLKLDVTGTGQEENPYEEFVPFYKSSENYPNKKKLSDIIKDVIPENPPLLDEEDKNLLKMYVENFLKETLFEEDDEEKDDKEIILESKTIMALIILKIIVKLIVNKQDVSPQEGVSPQNNSLSLTEILENIKKSAIEYHKNYSGITLFLFIINTLIDKVSIHKKDKEYKEYKKYKTNISSSVESNINYKINLNELLGERVKRKPSIVETTAEELKNKKEAAIKIQSDEEETKEKEETKGEEQNTNAVDERHENHVDVNTSAALLLSRH